MAKTPNLRLPLKQLRFGNVDARYEVNTRNPLDVEHFRQSFVEPAGISVEEFIKGDRFFVHGVKGAGKTSILRYIQLKTSDSGCINRFISFSTEISDIEREKIRSMSGIHIFEQKDVDVHNESAVDVWMIFILRQISKIIEENRISFSSHKDVAVFCELMKRFYDGEDNKGLLSWLSAALKGGKYKFKSKYIDADIRGPLSEKEREFPVNYVVEQSMRLLKSLGFESGGGVYIFFDELNLSFASRVTHKRDVILIRDLLVAIDRLNSFFIDEHKPIYIVAAARSEVLHALNAPTHEINKILADRGRELRWFAKTSGGDWPIIRLLEKKIRASETISRFPETENILEKYFHRDLFGMTPKDFIVETTWCNPRDLVLLFGEAASQSHSNEIYFGAPVIDRIIANYSAAAWREKAEELSVEYAAQEIQAIKKGLLGFERHFRISAFERNWANKADRDQTMKMMTTKYTLSKILDDLFRVGIVGQSFREPGRDSKSFTQHWSYRGDNTFDSSSWIIAHRALWPELRLGKIWGPS
ncbi:hypothetical protein [Mesorhizobium sp. CAU 1741]|uniref:P-loop ATPase, Sll1717 family n=1 Tax=Mesorhizobium sp. CAU 1741 TaxID=3140366 RepID=UPI00325A58CA